MDLYKTFKEVFNKMLEFSGPFMYLVLDDHTTKMVTAVFSFTELLEKNILYSDTLATINSSSSQQFRRDRHLARMHCLYFISPSVASVNQLKTILTYPKYLNSELAFSSSVPSNKLFELAKKDRACSLKRVRVHFLDFVVVERHFFSFGLLPPENKLRLREYFFATDLQPFYKSLSEGLAVNAEDLWKQLHLFAPGLLRQLNGLLSVLLSLKAAPDLVFSATCRDSAKLARLLKLWLDANPDARSLLGSYASHSADTRPVLFLASRREDPASPLLADWGYSAMVHELLAADNGVVRLPEGLVTSGSCGDPFFEEVKDLSFGDLAATLQKKVEEFKGKRKQPESLQEMAAFFREFPDLRKRQGEIAKHVQLADLLAKHIDRRNLIGRSEAEQELACSNAPLKFAEFVTHRHATEDKALLLALFLFRCGRTLFGDDRGSATAVREWLLHGARPPATTNKQLQTFFEQTEPVLAERPASRPFLAACVDLCLRVDNELFETGGWLGSARKLLAGVKDVFSQHRPLHVRRLAAWLEGRLDGLVVEGLFGNPAAKPSKGAVFFFVLGGVSYYEKHKLEELAQKYKGLDFVVGGSAVLSVDTYTALLCNCI